MIYLLRTSPHNESFILDRYSTTLEGCKELAINYVEYITACPNREDIIAEFIDSNTIRAKIENYYFNYWDQLFYVTAINSMD